MRHLVALTAVLAGLAIAPGVRAYSYQTALSAGCHERITLEALRRAEARGAAWPTLEPTRSERALLDDVPFDVPAEARDLATVTLLLGVRENDLRGRHGLDSTHLADVHGDPDEQRAHCLRRPEHDGPAGDEAALAQCRAFIDEQLALAATGLTAEGVLDPSIRDATPLVLSVAREVRAALPRAPFALGRALHTLQDSFTHTIRNDDGSRVRVVMNWVDVVRRHHRADRDGPAHRGELDECEARDPFRRARREQATEATAAVLEAWLAQGLDAATRADRVAAALDRALSYEPGCSSDNDFCDAPELRYTTKGCALGVPPRSTGFAVVLGVMLLAAIVTRRRRRAMGGMLLALVLATAAPRAFADDVRLGAAASGSIDHAAFAGAICVRWVATPSIHLGLDVEWNPWIAVERVEVRPGALNVFASAVWRHPIAERVALRSVLRAGSSTLLFDLFGAPRWTSGLYLGVSFLGLEVALGERWSFIVDPADVAMPIPQLEGAPLSYRQYRFTVGIERAF